jgi:outer membrane receptor protein involved in Fe transport
MRCKPILCVFLFLLGCYSFASSQAQTGSIRGYVSDDEGNVLPGVNVTISSPSMMGRPSFLTTAKGEFRFPSCPPGEYTVRAEIQGFEILEKKGIVVHVGVTVDVTMEMKPSEQKVEISVTAEAPVVDTKSSKVAFTITDTMLENVPIERDIYELVKHAPAVVEEGGSAAGKMVSIRGGTLQQTVFALDGVNMGDPTRNYVNKGISFDAIEEIEMISGGISADIGLTGGGYINVVTKSGGNSLAGTVTVQYNGEGLAKSTLPKEQSDAFGIPTVIFDKLFLDTSLTIGGPIIKYKFWFFLNPEFSKATRATAFIPFTDPTGVFHDKYDAKRKAWALFGKLSGQISSKLRFMGMYQYLDTNEDPNWNQVSNRGAYATYEAMPTLYDAGHTASTVLTYIIDENTFAELRGGFVFRYMDTHPFAMDNNDPSPAITDRATNERWGSYGTAELHHRYKWSTGLNITKFLDNFLGTEHELKLGVEYGGWYTQDDRGNNMNPHSIGYFDGTPWYYNDTRPYVGRITLSTVEPRGGMVDLNKAWRLSAFIQDSVRLGRKLTLNLGLRYDNEHATRPEETRKGYVDPFFNGLSNVLLPDLFSTTDITAGELKNFMVFSLIQPRLGLTYDIFGNGKTALKLSYSKYYEPILAANFGSVHPFRKTVTFLWYDLNKNGILDLPPTDNYSATSIPLLITDAEELSKTTDPNLKAPYVNEFMVGIQHELARNLSFMIQGTYKDNKNLIEQKDLNNPIGEDMWLPYTATEPGDDGEIGTSDDHSITVFGLKKTADSPYPYKTNIPELKRKYWGIELALVKRMANRWEFSGSVTFSKQYGNIGFGYYDSQGVRGYYMDPNQLINKYGRQNWDRPILVKLMGTVILPYGIHASAYYTYMSGAPMSEGEVSSGQIPYNRTVTIYFPTTIDGFALKEPSVTVFAEPPGSKRNSPTSLFDLRLEKTFNVPYGSLGIIFDAFNVFGSYRLYMSQDPGGYVYANGSFSRWPTYGKVLSAEGSRTLKLTIRYSFGR